MRVLESYGKANVVKLAATQWLHNSTLLPHRQNYMGKVVERAPGDGELIELICSIDFDQLQHFFALLSPFIDCSAA